MRDSSDINLLLIPSISSNELPSNLKVVLTGFGRVGHGAREILDLLPITEVSPEEFLYQEFDSPVYTQLELEDYYVARNGGEFDKKEFLVSVHISCVYLLKGGIRFLTKIWKKLVCCAGCG